MYQSNGRGLERIINGFPARPNQIPYQVALKVVTDKGMPGFCGGSIISRKHVLSAAHCTSPPVEKIYLRFGSIELNSGGVRMFVTRKNIVNHPNFNPTTLHNDISVIHLPQELVYNSRIQPISLPNRRDAQLTHEQRYARVSGWGSENSSGGTFSAVLRFVDLLVMGNKECKYHYNGRNQIPDSVLCAIGPYANQPGGQNQGHCTGDSGGPLIIESGYQRIQIGVVSFSSRNNCLQRPSGYTRTGWYLDFIRSATGIEF